MESERASSRPVKAWYRSNLDVLRLLSNCFMGFGNGVNDSAPGALLPYMQSDYDIGYAVVSLIFVANALGYLLSAPFTHVLESAAGRARAYGICMGLMSIGYLILIFRPQFWMTVAAFWFIGFGESFDLALNNVFCANYGSGTSALGVLHGSYGAGGTVGPLVATTMVTNTAPWQLFYGVALAITVFNGVFATCVFRGYENDSTSDEREPLLPEDSDDSIAQQPPASSVSEDKNNIIRQAILNRTTILGAVFIFAYQGAEVSISGWMIEFLITYRNGDPAVVGYVTAGFWAGISLGRFFLSPLAHVVGERISVWCLTAGCLGLQILIWVCPSIVADAVAAALIGLLLGPVYPCAVSVFGRLVSRRLQLTSLSFISAMGSSGGAVVPMLTGILAQRYGTVVLHPLCVGMYGVMLLCWLGLPKAKSEDSSSL